MLINLQPSRFSALIAKFLSCFDIYFVHSISFSNTSEGLYVLIISPNWLKLLKLCKFLNRFYIMDFLKLCSNTQKNTQISTWKVYFLDASNSLSCGNSYKLIANFIINIAVILIQKPYYYYKYIVEDILSLLVLENRTEQNYIQFSIILFST